MMELDPQSAGRINDVAKRKLNLDLFPVWWRKEVVAHGHCRCSTEDHFLIFKPYVGPTLDGKTSVFRERFISADKVG